MPRKQDSLELTSRFLRKQEAAFLFPAFPLADDQDAGKGVVLLQA
jgi:hypothetical protein